MESTSASFAKHTSVEELDGLLARTTKRNSMLLAGVLAIEMVAYYAMDYSVYIVALFGFSLLFCSYCLLTFERRSLAVHQRLTSLSMLAVLLVMTWFGLSVSCLVYYIGLAIYVTYVEKSHNWQLFIQTLNFVCFAISLSLFWEQPYRVEGAVAIELIALIDISIMVLFTGDVIRTYERHNQLAQISTELQTANLAHYVADSHAANGLLDWHKATLTEVRNDAEESLRNTKLTSARLAASREQLEQFTYAASHDLKEPIRTVRSFMQVVEKRLKPDQKSYPVVSEYLTHIKKSAWGMHELLANLLAYSRVVQMSLKVVSILLGQTCERHLTAFAKTNSFTYSIEEVGGGQVSVEMDRNMLSSILDHLIGNSLKFKTDGLDPSIHIAIGQPQEGFVDLVLSDEGIGIPAVYREQVFQLFARLHTRDRYDGSGVGLALVQRIAERHGGQAWIEGEQANGCSIHLRLPCTEA